MRYHIEKPDFESSLYGKRYICDHPVYSGCTLLSIGGKGIAIIQQRYDSVSKHTWWGEIDGWIADAIYLHPKFEDYFRERAGIPKDGLYPTVTVRQIMWALKMKPLKKERWETVFDRRDI